MHPPYSLDLVIEREFFFGTKGKSYFKNGIAEMLLCERWLNIYICMYTSIYVKYENVILQENVILFKTLRTLQPIWYIT